MAKSIGDLHSKITANASQFVAEFARADNASRRASAAIDREVTKVTRNIKKKFSAGDIGKDLMRGLGIGSGFAAAQEASQQIVAHYERAAAAAKEIEASTARQLDLTRQLIATRATEAQQLTAERKEEAELRQRLADFDAKDRSVVTGFDPVTGKTHRMTPGLSEADKVERGNIIEQLQAQALKVRKAEEAAAKASEQETRASTDANIRALGERLEAEHAIAEARRKQAGHVAEMAMKEEQETVERAERIEEKLHDAFDGLDERAQELVLNDALDQAFAALDGKAEAIAEVDAAAKKMNESLSSSMADVLLGVESLSDAFKALARDIAKAWIQKNVTDSIAGSITGSSIWKGIQAVTGFGGARADGGPVSAGSAYLVGEEGPEIFAPGRSGTVIPAGRTAAAMSGRGGVTVQQTNHFASGVTREDLAGMLPRIVEATKRAVADQVQRGGNFRKAFA